MTTKELNVRILKELKLYPTTDEIILESINTPYIKSFIDNLRYYNVDFNKIKSIIIDEIEYKKYINKTNYVVKVNYAMRNSFIEILNNFGVVWRTVTPIKDLCNHLTKNSSDYVYFCVDENGYLSWSTHTRWYDRLSPNDKLKYEFISLEELNDKLNTIHKNINDNILSIVRIDKFKLLNKML